MTPLISPAVGFGLRSLRIRGHRGLFGVSDRSVPTLQIWPMILSDQGSLERLWADYKLKLKTAYDFLVAEKYWFDMQIETTGPGWEPMESRTEDGSGSRNPCHLLNSDVTLDVTKWPRFSKPCHFCCSPPPATDSNTTGSNMEGYR